MPPKKKQATQRTLSNQARSQIRKQQTVVTIEDLPTEILSKIFSHLHDFSTTFKKNSPRRRASPLGSVYRLPEDRAPGLFLEAPHCLGGDIYDRKEIPDDEVPSFSFPLDAVAAASLRFRGIVHCLPEYFSRIIIYLDKRKPTLSSDIELYAKKCPLSVPLDVIVTRRHFPEDVDDAEMMREGSLARSVMKTLAPLLPRCRSFIFDVLHSSSLPYISQDFRGHCVNLGILKLESQIDDLDDNVLPSAAHIDHEQSFSFPSLFSLALDGYTFVDAFRVDSFKSQMKNLSIDTLSVRNLTVTHRGDQEFENFFIGQFARCLSEIGYIRHLTLGVDVPDNLGEFESGACQISMDHLTIFGFDHLALEDFFAVTFGSSLCSLHLIDTPISYDSLPVVHHLRLQRLPVDSSDDDEIIDYCTDCQFSTAIRRFLGHRLDLINCQGITDQDLEDIAFNCEPLRRLYIDRCPNITVEGLKTFVSTREKMISEQNLGQGEESEEESDDDDSQDSDTDSLFQCDIEADEVLIQGYLNDGESRGVPVRSIRRLQVSGLKWKLSKADRRWFQDRVGVFLFD